MEVGELLDTLVGDVGRLISFVFRILEFFLGLWYFLGHLVVHTFSVITTFLVSAALVLKEIGASLWDFGEGLCHGLLLIIHSVGLVTESFCQTIIDLKDFAVHVFTTIGQQLLDIQAFLAEMGTDVIYTVPAHILSSLEFVGNRTIDFGGAVLLMVADFLAQLVMAPLNVIQTLAHAVVILLRIPVHLVISFFQLPFPTLVGVLVTFTVIGVYWNTKFAIIPRIVSRAFWAVIGGLCHIWSLLKNSKRIVRVALNPEDSDLSSSSTRGLCVICQDETVSFISIPCQHVCLCYVCVKRLVTMDNRCPLCRGAVTKFERVYIPL